MALHNFIRESRIADKEFDACDADPNYSPLENDNDPSWPSDEPIVDNISMNTYRDEMAHALFHGL